MRRFVWMAAFAAACGTPKKYYRDADPSLAVERSSAAVERGAYIVHTIGACGACHNGRPGGQTFGGVTVENPAGVLYDYSSLLGGGSVLTFPGKEDKVAIYFPGLTPHPDNLGNWTDDQIIRAIRDGWGVDDQHLFFFMPFQQYQHMSDNDVQAVVAYLRSVAPAAPTTARIPNKIPGMLKMMANKSGHEPVSNVPDPPDGDVLARGEYLARLGHCAECHSVKGMKTVEPGEDGYMAGSPRLFEEEWGTYPAPNLTPDPVTGLGDYSADQIVTAIRERRMLSGEMMMPPMALFAEFYAQMTDEDLIALATFLKSLPPVEAKEAPRQLNEKGEAYAKWAEARVAAMKPPLLQPEPPAEAPAEEVTPEEGE